jgi:ketosteroid isomerase-like protein
MSEEKIESIVRDFGEAFVKRDVEKMLSFFAEDAVWVSPLSFIFPWLLFQNSGSCMNTNSGEYSTLFEI